MLLDPETLALATGVERLLPQEGLKTQALLRLVETNTPVCQTAFEAREGIRAPAASWWSAPRRGPRRRRGRLASFSSR